MGRHHPGLLNREYDAIMSSLEITERRQKRIAFSDPYYRIPAVFIGSKETAPGDASRRRRWRARRSAPSSAATTRPISRPSTRTPRSCSTPRRRRPISICWSGASTRSSADELLLSKFLGSREGACCHILGDAPAEPAYKRESYGIGLRKEDEELRERFNRAIAQVKADGTYDRIRAKYFPFDIK